MFQSVLQHPLSEPNTHSTGLENEILVDLALDSQSLSAFASTTESRESAFENDSELIPSSCGVMIWFGIKAIDCITALKKIPLPTFHFTVKDVAMLFFRFFFTVFFLISAYEPNAIYSWKGK